MDHIEEHNIFDSSSKYESGNFYLLKNGYLIQIMKVLEKTIPPDVEYNVETDNPITTIKIICDFEEQKLNPNILRKNLSRAFLNEKINLKIELSDQ